LRGHGPAKENGHRVETRRGEAEKLFEMISKDNGDDVGTERPRRNDCDIRCEVENLKLRTILAVFRSSPFYIPYLEPTLLEQMTDGSWPVWNYISIWPAQAI
jgi:hypothetical protein